MMAKGLAERGHNVHVLAKTSAPASVRFADGYWLHRVAPEARQGEFTMWKLDLPESIADWAEAVKQELRGLRTFGLDVVSFPIWDVEGAAIVDEPDLGVVMSLHTTYAMAKEFKPEWQARPLYEHFFVKKVIRQERRLLESAPVVLANSEAIVADLTNAYGVDFSARTVLAPHGTTIHSWKIRRAARCVASMRRAFSLATSANSSRAKASTSPQGRSPNC